MPAKRYGTLTHTIQQHIRRIRIVNLPDIIIKAHYLCHLLYFMFLIKFSIFDIIIINAPTKVNTIYTVFNDDGSRLRG